MEIGLTKEKQREYLLTCIHNRKPEELVRLFTQEGVNANFFINHMKNTPLHIIAAMDIPETLDTQKQIN